MATIYRYLSMFLLLLFKEVFCQYSCSNRPDGRCTPCDCNPECFDLSDETNCINSSNIQDVLQPHLGVRQDSKFFPPPPLPPFPLCLEKTTSSQPPSIQTSSSTAVTTTRLTRQTIHDSVTTSTERYKQTTEINTVPSTDKQTMSPTSTTLRPPCQRDVFNDPFCRYNYKGYYKHPTDCEKYIVCEWGNYFECHCPPLTRWEVKFSACIWKYMSPCLSRGMSRTTTTKVTTTPASTRAITNRAKTNSFMEPSKIARLYELFL